MPRTGYRPPTLAANQRDDKASAPFRVEAVAAKPEVAVLGEAATADLQLRAESS